MAECWKRMVSNRMAVGVLDLTCCLSYEQLCPWCGKCDVKVLRDGGG